MLEKLNLDVEVEKTVYKEEKDALSIKLEMCIRDRADSMP